MAGIDAELRSRYVRKPIWGFGPIGWVLLVVLAWMVVGAVRIGDLQFFIFSTLHSTLGIGPVYYLVGRWMPYAWFQLREPSFGLAPLMIVLILCHFCPRRVAWWKYVLLGLWSVLPPVVFFAIAMGLRATRGLGSLDPGLNLLRSVVDVVCTCGVLALVMGRWKPTAVATAGVLAALAEHAYPGHLHGILGPWRVGDFELPTMILYHGSIIGAMVWWCVIERARWRVLCSPTACRRCGYDRTGLATHAVCPECGTPAPVVEVSHSDSSGRGATMGA